MNVSCESKSSTSIYSLCCRSAMLRTEFLVGFECNNRRIQMYLHRCRVCHVAHRSNKSGFTDVPNQCSCNCYVNRMERYPRKSYPLTSALGGGLDSLQRFMKALLICSFSTRGPGVRSLTELLQHRMLCNTVRRDHHILHHQGSRLPSFFQQWVDVPPVRYVFRRLFTIHKSNKHFANKFRHTRESTYG